MAVKKKTEKSEEMTLEESFAALERTIEALENQNITLEESFKEYQRGMELLKKCNEKIDTVEKEMLVLNEDGEAYEF